MTGAQRGGDRSGSVLGPYRIEELLGRGGMGEVYRATDTRKGRVVALKLLHPNLADDAGFRDRFMRESQVAARINDPHVIPIHDWGEIDGLLFIDMRLVTGTDLGRLLATGPIGEQRAVAIVSQVADALDAAHADGLVHRDVKPDNILLDSRDFAYLVDFGLAQAANDTRLTATGSAIGSFAYMAPERFGNTPVGAPADIYALACVLYQCIAGRPPFGPDTIERLISSHLTATPQRLGSALDPVIARGMAKDPAARYATAGEMLRDARAALDGSPTAAAATEPVGARPTRQAPVGAWDQTQMAPASGANAGYPAGGGAAGYGATGHGSSGYGSSGYGPSGYGPSAPAPSRSRLPLVVGALATVLVVVVGVAAWLLTRDSGTPSTAAPDADAAQQASSTTSAPPLTTVVTETATATQPTATATGPTAPTAAAVGTTVPGDLGLSIPMTRPTCDGSGIVVVGNATAPGTYAQEISGYLAANPGASYLRTDQSCLSLRQADDAGNAIYAVYYPAGRTVGEICGKRAAVGGYGKWLDNSTDPRSQVACG